MLFSVYDPSLSISKFFFKNTSNKESLPTLPILMDMSPEPDIYFYLALPKLEQKNLLQDKIQ